MTILFPGAERGQKVSTLETGKEIIARSLEPTSPQAATRLRQESDWRGNYAERFVDALQTVSATNASNAQAQALLDACYQSFSFQRDGTTVPLQHLLEKNHPALTVHPVTTIQIDGTGSQRSIHVPYHSTRLDEKKFRHVAAEWEQQGVIEPSARESWEWVLNNDKDIRKGLENTIFVILGAGAALGPFEPLMELGATVAAVDLPKPSVWKRLRKIAKKSTGTLLAPSLDDGSSLGCDLLEQLPEIAQWVCTLDPSKRLVIGNFAYADGAKFVTVSLAMDVLSQYVLLHRVTQKENAVALSYLCSPTDCFRVPSQVVADSRNRFESWGLASFIRPALSAVTSHAILAPNYKTRDEEHSIVDCFVLQQGPNYALAKRIQHCRALVARAQGFIVSANIAPASSTDSVTKNALLAAGYGGAQFFPPVEIFEPRTANHIMALLVLHDVFNPCAAANPLQQLQHPMDLFVANAVHGGLWRMPYKLRTVLEVAVVGYFVDKYKGLVSFSAGALCAYKYAKL